MKRVNNLIPLIVDLDNLYLAFWKASKGKRYSRAVINYQKDLDAHLLLLRDRILSRDLDIGNYRYFKIYDPKEREICACAFHEQVLHHTLMNVCHPYFEKHQIYDSYATRKGKGTYAALDRTRHFTRNYSWYLKLDVQKFFASVHHQVLKQQLYRQFKDKHLLDLLYQIIDSYEDLEGRGLPIGNLTSQYFANHFLSELDHYIKEELRVKAYVRYMDDLLLWSNQKKELLDVFREIEHFMKECLKCQLKPMTLNATKHGITFLGYRVFSHYIHLSQRSKQRYIRKLKSLREAFFNNSISEKAYSDRLRALTAFVKKADSLKFRKMVLTQELVLH